MSKGIFFISNISNHQGTHFQQSATDIVNNFNMIHEFKWPMKQHTTTAEWRACIKSIRSLCDESKENLHTPLGPFRYTTKNITHGSNTYKCLTEHAGALNFKQT